MNGQVTMYIDGLGIDEHLGQVNGSSSLGYATDHLGSVLNTAPGGFANSFGPYGELLPGTDAVIAGSNAPVLYGFAGRQYDKESGLYYNRARMYDPSIGRWLTKDPLGFGGGDSNLYAYVLNDSVNAIDPRGTDLLLIYNGATSSNPFGHVAIAVTGAGVYSFGNSTELGSSTTEYLAGQAARRDTTVFTIHTTAEQDSAVLQYLGQFTSNNGVNAFPDNCAARVEGALSAAGFSAPNAPFPQVLLLIGYLSSLPNQSIPQNGSIPINLSVFNPSQKVAN